MSDKEVSINNLCQPPGSWEDVRIDYYAFGNYLSSKGERSTCISQDQKDDSRRKSWTKKQHYFEAACKKF